MGALGSDSVQGAGQRMAGRDGAHTPITLPALRHQPHFFALNIQRLETNARASLSPYSGRAAGAAGPHKSQAVQGHASC